MKIAELVAGDYVVDSRVVTIPTETDPDRTKIVYEHSPIGVTLEYFGGDYVILTIEDTQVDLWQLEAEGYDAYRYVSYPGESEREFMFDQHNLMLTII